MAVIPFVTNDGPGSEILIKRASEVNDDEFNTEALRALVQNMIDTKEDHGCVGMSGPNL
ncbi:MAG: hypothetical protein PHW76_09255 [Alphaproteobacteria bacterium]|nr:hypothetical protein [Alphaproteobacteria bacterium]